MVKPPVYERPSKHNSKEGNSILDASSEIDPSTNRLSKEDKPSARKMRQEMKMKKYMMNQNRYSDSKKMRDDKDNID